MSDDNREATVREVDGKLVLDDPVSREVIAAVGRHNARQGCARTMEANRERVGHFVRRVTELGRSPSEVVIVVACVDDVNGRELANALMPYFDWQAIRDRGEVPFARGIAMRKGVEEFVSLIDTDAGLKLSLWDDLAVVVIDHGIAEVYPAT